MFKYDSLIDEYQRKGIPNYNYDGYIRKIISNLVGRIFDGNDSIIKQAVDESKLYKFIKNITVDRTKCIIEYDEGIVFFNVIPKNYYEMFCDDIFKIRKLKGNCHYVTEKMLEECKDYSNISAVTSLCINTDYRFFFHSYIHDRSRNLVIDFSRNFMMNKDDYDRLFCFHEINDLNYSEYKSRLNDSQYSIDNDNVYSLLYLACEKLVDSDIDIDELVSDKIGMTK